MGRHSFGFEAALCAVMLIAASAFGAAATKPEPTLVDTSSTAGQVIDQSPAYDTSSTYRAAKAFDRVFSTMNSCWIAKLDADNPVAFFVYEFNTPTVVDCIRLQNSEKWGETSRAPKDWTFEGSNDTNSNWVVLDTQTGHTGWTSNEFRTCYFVNRNAYKYYKFACTRNNNANMVALCEVEFLAGSVANLARSGAGAVAQDLSSPVVTASGASYPASKLFDGIRKNNGSRWLCAKADHMYFVYRFNEPTRVNSMLVCTPGNTWGWSTSTRAPKVWTFSGSNDGENWTTLDSETVTDWSSDPEARYYEFENIKKYQYYKYDCTALNGATDNLQLDEMEFYFKNDGRPILGGCSVERTSATSLSVSAAMDVNAADTLSYIVYDGATATTNSFATAVAEGQTGTGTITGLTADKTYEISILAENTAGSDVYSAGTFYTGDLTLGTTVNASEASLTAGNVAVSRATADPLPLTVYYTITGSTGSQGVTWAEPVAVTIPAGQTTGYLLVTPLADLSVGENIAVTVALASGNYGIPASGNSAMLTIENSDAPAGWEAMVITNAYDNPAGGFFGAAYGNALNNTSGRVIRFVKPEDASAGLREFTQYAGDWVYVDQGETTFTSDWMLFVSANAPTNAATVSAITCATQAGKVDGFKSKQGVITYAGSWYVPSDGTYSFRMHMAYTGIFSLDGKLILRQPTPYAAVTTNGVALTAGWHSFYAAFSSTSGGSNANCWIGPADGETLGFSFSANNDTLTKDAPGSAFETANSYGFSQAFSNVLVPSMWAKDGDVVIDCKNAQGDLRVIGQLASVSHDFIFVNVPAGRTLEFGRPVANNLTGWQDLTSCAYQEWTHTRLPAGVGIRFEGASAIDGSWTASGRGVWAAGDHSAFSLGNSAVLFVDVQNFFGTHGESEFHYPDGLYSLQVMKPGVLGDTAKIFVPNNHGFGFGGSPITLTSNSKLPVTRVSSTTFIFRNNLELGTGAVVNKTLTGGFGDRFMGEVSGPQGAARITGYSSYMTFNGPVNVKDVTTQQIACRTTFWPAAGSGPSSITGMLTIGSGNDIKAGPTSGWDYCGPNFCYCPETLEHPLSVNIVTANGAQFCPQNVGPNSWGQFSHTTYQGANLTTCSNATVNVAKLTGSGIHLRAAAPCPKTQAFDERIYEDGVGPANFVFGEINGNAAMPIFVSSNVNITVTNIAKATAFHYEVMSNGVNAAVLDIEGDVADGTTITATDIAMLPARIKGFTGHDITLTDTAEGREYPVVFDFDNHGGVPVGGCDGSGTLAGAPTTGTINLTLTGTPKTGTWGILKFDTVPSGQFDNWGLDSNWTLNVPKTYEGYLVTVTKTDTGFELHAGKGLMLIVR